MPRAKPNHCQTQQRGRRSPKAGSRQPLRLEDLANVGPATLGDFEVLGVRSIGDLAKRDPFQLWQDLCKRTGQRHDPCCIDVFMSAVSQAKGDPPCPWWKFTPERKLRFPGV